MRSFLFISYLVVACTASTATAQWPGFRGELLRDATSGEVGLLQNWPDGGPPLVWERDGLGDAAATLAVVDGVIYTAGSIERKAYLHALRLSDGEQIWRTEIAGASTVTPTPMVDSGKVYIQLKGRVYCHDAEDGTVYWEQQILGPGKNYDVGNALCNIPVYVDGRLFCTTGYGPVVWTTFDLAADGKSLKKAWNNPAIHPFQESVICIGGMLFGSGDVTWDDFDAYPDLLVNGKPLRDWADQKQPPPLDRRHDERKKRIFHFYDREAGGRDRTGLVCQDLKTGKVLGVRYGFPRIGFSGLMMAVGDDRIYGVWSDICDEVWLIEPTPSMQVRGSFQIPEPDKRPGDQPLIAIAHGRYSAPVIADGKLLLRVRDQLRIYDIRSQK